jgi:diadenosine tetraphosphate (Ap4A) HIT family hydrolase
MREGEPLNLPGFGVIEPERVIQVDELFAVVRDKYPVSPGHTLIIARRAAQKFSELTTAEKVRLMELVTEVQNALLREAPKPDAFNLGVNDGPAAGQTMPQFHFHVIPRYTGDVADPRGGVRWVIPEKVKYWEDDSAELGEGQIKEYSDVNRSISEARAESCDRCLSDASLREWILEPCLPVPAFGDVASSLVKVATIGLNPSSGEFLLRGGYRPKEKRLPVLEDFAVYSRRRLSVANLTFAAEKRARYFQNEPHEFFVKLGNLMGACQRDWSYKSGTAVHVDLVACITTKSWGNLPPVVAEAICGNCSIHLKRTLQKLPRDAALLCDGKSACQAIAAIGGCDWATLCEFTAADGARKPLRVVTGIAREEAGGRVFFGWNIPANWLPDEALVKVGEWLRTKVQA